MNLLAAVTRLKSGVRTQTVSEERLALWEDLSKLASGEAERMVVRRQRGV
jgi:hypothetical protein